MKKIFSTILFATIILSTMMPTLAVNYSYKWYDPKTNSSGSAEMMTIGRGDEKVYVIGLLIKDKGCVINTVENKGNNLLGGKCIGITGPDVGHVYYWREYKPHTYNTEVNGIIEERRQEGMYLYSN